MGAPVMHTRLACMRCRRPAARAWDRWFCDDCRDALAADAAAVRERECGMVCDCDACARLKSTAALVLRDGSGAGAARLVALDEVREVSL